MLIVGGLARGEHAHRLPEEILPAPASDRAQAGVHKLNPAVDSRDDHGRPALLDRVGQLPDGVGLFDPAAHGQPEAKRQSEDQAGDDGGLDGRADPVATPMIRRKFEGDEFARCG